MCQQTLIDSTIKKHREESSRKDHLFTNNEGSLVALGLFRGNPSPCFMLTFSGESVRVPRVVVIFCTCAVSHVARRIRYILTTGSASTSSVRSGPSKSLDRMAVNQNTAQPMPASPIN